MFQSEGAWSLVLGEKAPVAKEML